MINSISKELYEVQIPSYNGEVKMLPFDLSNINNVPEQFKELVSKMIEFLPIKKGIAYLTIDGKFVESGKTQRRGGPHIDGNYLKENSGGYRYKDSKLFLSQKEYRKIRLKNLLETL